jgi:putative ABC transport system permease protein
MRSAFAWPWERRRATCCAWCWPKACLLTLLGVAAGVVGALATTPLIRAELFGIGAADPLTFLALTVLLAAVAMAAGWVPARRATRVDPMVALRYE